MTTNVLLPLLHAHDHAAFMPFLRVSSRTQQRLQIMKFLPTPVASQDEQLNNEEIGIVITVMALLAKLLRVTTRLMMPEMASCQVTVTTICLRRIQYSSWKHNCNDRENF